MRACARYCVCACHRFIVCIVCVSLGITVGWFVIKAVSLAQPSPFGWLQAAPPQSPASQPDNCRRVVGLPCCAEQPRTDKGTVVSAHHLLCCHAPPHTAPPHTPTHTYTYPPIHHSGTATHTPALWVMLAHTHSPPRRHHMFAC